MHYNQAFTILDLPYRTVTASSFNVSTAPTNIDIVLQPVCRIKFSMTSTLGNINSSTTYYFTVNTSHSYTRYVYLDGVVNLGISSLASSSSKLFPRFSCDGVTSYLNGCTISASYKYLHFNNLIYDTYDRTYTGSITTKTTSY